MDEKHSRGNPAALLPIVMFLALFLGAGFLTGDFNSMPAIVGFLIALMAALLQNRKLSFEEKIRIAAEGAGDENILTMCLIYLLAGAFSGTIQAAGGVESTVNLCLSLLPSHVAVAGLFVIGCFISLAMGTSMGTIAALAPIGAGISGKTGISMAVCIGAVVCGAMFGDNLSMISDTTIAAVKTQGCEMRDKFRENFLIVLPAALLTVVIFLVLTRDMNYQAQEDLDYQILRVIPYLAVLGGALAGLNVFGVLAGGIILSAAVGVVTGAFGLGEMFQVMKDGIVSMYDITVISIIVACIVALVRHNGGIDWILGMIRRKIKGPRGAEAGIAALSVLVDLCTANNTVAIVIAGPIAKEISGEYGVTGRRSASLLDTFTSACQGLIPYGAQLLSAAGLSGLTPYQIIPYCFYPVLMAVSGIAFIIFKGSSSNKA